MNIEEMMRWDREEAPKWEPWSPNVRFEIPSEKEDWKYRAHLETLLIDFAVGLMGERVRWRSVHFDQKARGEGGIGMIDIGGLNFTGCKLYWHEGDEIDRMRNMSKGFVYVRHDSYPPTG